jgi:hypothetical protein
MRSIFQVGIPLALLTTFGVLAWLTLLMSSMSVDAFLWLALLCIVLRPDRMALRLMIALLPVRDITPDLAQACNEIVRTCKAQLILDGRPHNILIQPRLYINDGILMLQMNADRTSKAVCRQKVQDMFDARFTSLEKMKLLQLCFSMQITLQEPVISNHVLLEIAASKIHPSSAKALS